MATRLKMVCTEKTVRKHWSADKKFIDGVKLGVVSSGSEENKSFFDSTPSGSIEFGTINHEAAAEFEPGTEYYVTIERAGA